MFDDKVGRVGGYRKVGRIRRIRMSRRIGESEDRRAGRSENQRFGKIGVVRESEYIGESEHWRAGVLDKSERLENQRVGERSDQRPGGIVERRKSMKTSWAKERV